MMKIKRVLTDAAAERATELGAGVLFTFAGVSFVEGTDAQDKARYLVAWKNEAGELLRCIELALPEWYELCAQYLMSLQPGTAQAAAETLRLELEALEAAY